LNMGARLKAWWNSGNWVPAVSAVLLVSKVWGALAASKLNLLSRKKAKNVIPMKSNGKTIGKNMPQCGICLESGSFAGTIGRRAS
ncbi:hypothetical protein, partial [Pseudooceanicola nitratireducens]|uniref:hypothetical protein n=1 Tax=Pseudooceanicola nitratireducens TaxID=517719 RepID=UPI0035128ADC